MLGVGTVRERREGGEEGEKKRGRGAVKYS